MLFPAPFISTSIPTSSPEVVTEKTAAPQGQIKREIMEVWNDWNAVRLARCESRWQPWRINYEDRKYNGHASVGLFQISLIHGYATSTLLDRQKNIRIAHKLYEEQGWSPWKNCGEKLGLIEEHISKE